MQTLIACGQFTLCYELMDYILNLKADKDKHIEDFAEIDVLYEALEADWILFNQEPLWLLDKLV